MGTQITPWQFRQVDARPEQRLRVLQLSQRSMEKAHQLPTIVRQTVGQARLQIRPNILIRVELGGVGGKRCYMEPFVFFEKAFDLTAAVDRQPVPVRGTFSIRHAACLK